MAHNADACPELNTPRPVEAPAPTEAPQASSTGKVTEPQEAPAGGIPEQETPRVLTQATRLQDLYLYLRDVLEGQIDEYFSAMYRYDAEVARTAKGQRDVQTRGFGPLTDETTVGELRYRWIAVYPVTGGNEGHYIHVDLIWQREYTEGRVPLFLGKTFQGMDHAIQMANTLTRELEKAGLV